MGKKIIFATLGLAALAFGGIWWSKMRPPKDITELQAIPIAMAALRNFCANREIAQGRPSEFLFQSKAPSTDARFRWSFAYMNKFTNPWQKIVINVGVKGDTSVEYSPIAVPPDAVLPPRPPPRAALAESELLEPSAGGKGVAP